MAFLWNKKNLFKIKWSFPLLIGLWTVMICGNLTSLISHAGKPVAKAQGLNRWPEETQFGKIGDKRVLAVFLHPHCACSLATLKELDRLLPSLIGTMDVRLIFIQPEGRNLEWVRSGLWQKAIALPGVRVLIDPSGSEIDRFGPKVSGHAMLFDEAGRLVVSGGLATALGREAEVPIAPLSGCGLKDSSVAGHSGDQQSLRL